MTQPDDYTALAPWIVTDDTAALLDFVTHAFDGKDGWPALPSLLRVWVPDADAAMARAVEQGDAGS